MRSYLVIAILAAGLPFAFRAPYIGILFWCWVSYANPHLYTWQLRTLPIAVIVGAVTLVGMVVSGQTRRIPWTRETVLLVLLWIWFSVTTCFALEPQAAFEHWEKVSKILLMTFATLMLIQEKRKFTLLFGTIGFSLGVIGLWGMVWGITSGAESPYEGPDGSFIADNNDLALALNMTLPIFLLVRKNFSNLWLRRLFFAFFAGSVVAIIFTFSRGGFLGLCIVAGGFFSQAKNKLATGILIAFLGFTGLLLVPQRWTERMMTIETYQEDASAMGRINAWWVAVNVARTHITGGGFDMFTPQRFLEYAPDPLDFHDAHSIYFEILGEQGFIGLTLFLLLLVSSLASLRTLKKRLRHDPRYEWYTNYCTMLMIAIGAYMMNGAFLGRAYFDLFYHLISGVILLKFLYQQEAQQVEQVPVLSTEAEIESPTLDMWEAYARKTRKTVWGQSGQLSGAP